jgi:hypothetical protein
MLYPSRVGNNSSRTPLNDILMENKNPLVQISELDVSVSENGYVLPKFM